MQKSNLKHSTKLHNIFENDIIDFSTVNFKPCPHQTKRQQFQKDHIMLQWSFMWSLSRIVKAMWTNNMEQLHIIRPRHSAA